MSNVPFSLQLWNKEKRRKAKAASAARRKREARRIMESAAYHRLRSQDERLASNVRKEHAEIARTMERQAEKVDPSIHQGAMSLE